MIMSTSRSLRAYKAAKRRRTKARDAYDGIYALARRRDYRSALQAMVQPSTGRLTKEFSGDVNHSWYVVGDLLYRNGEHLRALRAFRRALRAWPEDPEAMWAIGDCYSELGRYKSAEMAYRRSVALKSDNRVLFNLGNALFDQGKFRPAMEIYRSIKANDKTLASNVRRNIARAVFELGRLKAKPARPRS